MILTLAASEDDEIGRPAGTEHITASHGLATQTSTQIIRSERLVIPAHIGTYALAELGFWRVG